MEAEVLYQLALVKLKGIGPILGRKLVAHCGGVEAIFQESSKNLDKIPGMRASVSAKDVRERALKQAEHELKFIEKNGIQTHFFLDQSYSRRLKNCIDAPLLLFSQGRMDMNLQKSIAIVGTRKATSYGNTMAERIVEGLKAYNPLVMSGLAVGIDICAHRAAVREGLQTIACLGSSMDKVYPSYHQKTAREMQENGGLITEFWSGTKPDRENFPQRNRIVAGMVDLLIVVESTRTGGSMITAKLAHGYNRELMAVPGKATDEVSEGCNLLIQREQAGILLEPEDIVRYMGWDLQAKREEAKQQKLFLDLSEEQQKIVDVLQESKCAVDILAEKTQMPASKISANLLELEFAGVVKSLPGKVYALR